VFVTVDELETVTYNSETQNELKEIYLPWIPIYLKAKANILE